MKTLIKILLIAFLLQSCEIQKEASKQKNDIDFSESEKTTTFRKGDTVTFVVPNVIYKDTVIKTISTQGTVLRNYYDSNGNIYKNDCLPAEIAIINERLTTLTDQSKIKDKTKEESYFDNPLLWIIIALAVVVLLKK